MHILLNRRVLILDISKWFNNLEREIYFFFSEYMGAWEMVTFNNVFRNLIRP